MTDATVRHSSKPPFNIVQLELFLAYMLNLKRVVNRTLSVLNDDVHTVPSVSGLRKLHTCADHKTHFQQDTNTKECLFLAFIGLEYIGIKLI